MTPGGSEGGLAAFEPDHAGVDAVRPAVNFDARAEGVPLDILLIHYTGMASAEKAVEWLTVAESRVSCHYFICEDGQILQLLPERLRAWHAGLSEWHGASDINSRSIGIEIANSGHPGGYPDFTDAQVAAVIELCRDCGTRRAIPPERVLAHSDVAPHRKQDPGEKFPWQKLYEAGVGHWVQASWPGGGRYLQRGDAGAPVEALQSMLSLYGYGIEITGIFCERTEAVITAFQRHFRQMRVDGVADASTIDTLHRLIAALPKYG